MNRSVFLATALFGTVVMLSASSSSGTTQKQEKAKGFPTTQINVKAWDGLRYTYSDHQIVAGTSQKRVLAWLGAPKSELAPGVLVFDNCEPDQEIAAGCRDLVISFSDGKVEKMVFGNPTMTELIAFNAQRHQRDEEVAMASSEPQE